VPGGRRFPGAAYSRAQAIDSKRFVARIWRSADDRNSRRFRSRENQKDKKMPNREAIFPANRHALYDVHRYSAAIRSGDLLFVSGQVGSRGDGSPEPDFKRQVELAFDNLKATLAGAGCSFDDLVDVTTFHTDPQTQLETVMAVRADIFVDPPHPNWTAIGVTWLAGFEFEIKVIARLPDGQV
jgi:enamine deaminase RidA (YjgF/YER057c/UK114 family)